MATQKSMGKKIGIRIDEATLEKLDSILEKEHISRSTMIRDAINIWLNIRINKNFNPDSDFLLISLNIFRTALENLDEQTLDKMSKVAYANNRNTIANTPKEYQKYHEINGEVLTDANRHRKMEERIKDLIDYVYNQSSYKWFDEINYKIQQTKVIISGTHRLGDNFSRFIKFHLLNHMSELQFQLEETHYKTIERGNEKINSLNFTFTPLELETT